MAQQFNILEDEMGAIEDASISPVIVKESFSKWLSDGHAKKYPLAVYLSCIDKVSAYLIRRKISTVDLWELTNYGLFKNVYDKAINDKLFKATDKKTHAVFVQVGKDFLKFLKSKPAIHEVPAIPIKLSSQPDSHLTIKESIIRVLENEQRGMTVEQIYNKIIENRLYSFGVQNPLNVVRVEVDRACMNSNYTIRATKDCFRFERNQKGEKVYFLLSPTPTNKTGQLNFYVNSESTILGEVKKEPSNIEILNDSIERHFQIWMELKNYSPSTARNYCSAVNRTVQDFKTLVDAAVIDSPAIPEAVRKFVTLLHQDKRFIAANSTAHNQLSAALAAFAQFVDSDASINTVPTVISPKTASNVDFTSIIVTVLSAHFSNGFRLDSPIELLRFRSFATEDFGEEVTLNDKELKQLISTCGTLFNGKVYIVSTETEIKIKNEIDTAFKSGMEIIFYDAFYEKHEEWLYPASVISVEMLKCILSKLYPNYKHRGNYVTNVAIDGSELAKIEREITRVWGNDILLNYEQLADRLPNITLEKIKYALAYSNDFIWNSEGVYTHVNMFQLSEMERVVIADFAAKSCSINGFVSLNDIPLGEIEEKNYELTLTAIHNAVFRICLAGNFDRNGKIVTYKGDTLNALELMKNYCRTIEKCSLDDLLSYEKDLTGEIHRWISMEAGYAVLIRADKNAYIAEKYVDFNIAEIDNAIDMFMVGEYLPLKSFTTFAAFPYCGQAWNLFLLESYCRRFSERFRFEVLSVNSKNAGVVVRKNCRLSYAEILVDAVAKSNITLEKKIVEEFLCSNGYIGRRSYAKVNELIEQAKNI